MIKARQKHTAMLQIPIKGHQLNLKGKKKTSETTSLKLPNIECKTEAGNLQKLLKTVFCFFFLDNSIVIVSGGGGIWTLVLFIEETGNATELQCSWLLKTAWIDLLNPLSSQQSVSHIMHDSSFSFFFWVPGLDITFDLNLL